MPPGSRDSQLPQIEATESIELFRLSQPADERSPFTNSAEDVDGHALPPSLPQIHTPTRANTAPFLGSPLHERRHVSQGSRSPAKSRSDTYKPDLESSGQRLVISYKRLNRLRDSVLLLRVQVDNERQKSIEVGDFRTESQSAFVELINSSMTSENTQLYRSALVEKHEQVLLDNEALAAQLQVTRELERKLSSREYALARREAAFMNAARTLLLGNDLDLDMPEQVDWRDNAGLHSDSGHGSAARNGHHPAQEFKDAYLDKMGDLNLLRERLMETRQDYENAVAVRELHTEQGRYLAMSDEKFHNDYVQKRKLLEEDLEAVRNATEHLKSLCVSKGLDPDVGRKPESEVTSERDNSDDDAAASAPQQRLGIKNSLSAALELALQDPLLAKLASTVRAPEDDDGDSPGNGSRVAEWLDQITLDEQSDDNEARETFVDPLEMYSSGLSEDMDIAHLADQTITGLTRNHFEPPDPPDPPDDLQPDAVAFGSRIQVSQPQRISEFSPQRRSSCSHPGLDRSDSVLQLFDLPHSPRQRSRTSQSETRLHPRVHER